MKITVYCTASSGYCEELKTYLDDNSVRYEEKLIDQDEKARNSMMQYTGGFFGVPYTVIEKDGVTNTVIGFDKGKIDQYIYRNS